MTSIPQYATVPVRTGAVRLAPATVQAKGQRFGVAQGVVKRFMVCPESVRPEASVMVPEIIIAVQRPALQTPFSPQRPPLWRKGVENGFNQDQVRATFHQRLVDSR